MRFLLDANLPRSLFVRLLALGHDAEFARDIGLGDATDDKIAAHSQSSRAGLLTRDLDFADIRHYPPEQYAGIVVLRLPDHTVAADVGGVMERFLSNPIFVTHLPGRLAIVEADRVRFRPALILP
jgi:predicted nuclease of predicted toxin-antitoxin system